MHHFQTPGLETWEISFLTSKKLIWLPQKELKKKKSKADFLFWRLDNKYITEIIRHSDQKATCGQYVPQGPAQVKGNIKQYWKHFILSSLQNYPSLKPNFCLSPVPSCSVLAHIIISYSSLSNISRQPLLCTAFRVFSKPGNLQEIWRQETPDEYLVKSWPCKGSILQKTINKRWLLHRSVLDLEDRTVHGGTSALRKESSLEKIYH